MFEQIVALAQVKPACLLADKGYDTDTIHAKLKAERVHPVIPPKSNRKTVIRWNRRIYR